MKTEIDDGSAIIEFVGFAVLILVPLAYLVITVFTVQKAVFAVGAAAREAGRAFVLADTTDEGMRRAQLAADLALESQGISGGTLGFHAAGTSCSSPTITPELDPGSRYVVCYRLDVALPFADKGFIVSEIHSAAVTGRYLLVVDEFRTQR